MDHESLLIGLANAYANIASDPCPWCHEIAWSAGLVTQTALSTVNRDGNAVFAFIDGMTVAALYSAVFTCQACRYQATFTLHVQEDRVE